jgi:hypothetical protein
MEKKTKGFIKVEHELLDNLVLKPVEKCLLLLLRRLRTAPKGCCPSHAYLKKRLAIKHRKTLLRSLDRLAMFGYITWKNRGKNLTNKYIFRDDPDFERAYLNNQRLREIMSRKQKEQYNKRLLQQGVESKKIRLIK